MRRKWLLAAGGLAALLAGCDEIAGERVELGRPAPGYAATTLAGDSVGLHELRGQVVLLNVWATWCAPCREEIPDLQELYVRHADRGFEVVGVSVDGRNERENIRRFAESFNVSYTIWHDPDDAIGNRFRTIGVPTTFLIDRQGVLVWRHMGPVTADDASLNEALERALADG
jgi:cytochrome c biogenesis protein CcmG, thiol:disulfide interchange protein DsbE